jgi:multiple sugar transport system permease protein
MCILPAIWLAMCAFKTRLEITAWPPIFIFVPTFANFSTLNANHNLGLLTSNSLIVACGTTVFTLLLGLPSSFYFSRIRNQIRQNLLLFLLSTKMVPLIAIALPFYMLFTTIGLHGNLVGLIVAQSVACLPLTIWLMSGFFADIPTEIYWAAQLDGLSARQSFWYILVRVAAPGVGVSVIFTVIFSWNDYLVASILTTAETRTLTAELPILVTQSVTQWGQLCSGIILSLLPISLLALLARRYFIEGITSGTLKKF